MTNDSKSKWKEQRKYQVYNRMDLLTEQSESWKSQNMVFFSRIYKKYLQRKKKVTAIYEVDLV